MKVLLLLSAIVIVSGCSAPSQDELNAKIKKCTDSGMEFTYMRDYKNTPIDVVCVRKHANEK